MPAMTKRDMEKAKGGRTRKSYYTVSFLFLFFFFLFFPPLLFPYLSSSWPAYFVLVIDSTKYAGHDEERYGKSKGGKNKKKKKRKRKETVLASEDVLVSGPFDRCSSRETTARPRR
jgi:hypothetical protein